MKNSEIKSLSTEELQERIGSVELSLQKLKFAHAVSPIENPMQIRDMKKLLARLKTDLHQRVLEDVAEKVRDERVDMEGAREFQKTHVFASPVKLSSIKKIISQTV